MFSKHFIVPILALALSACAAAPEPTHSNIHPVVEVQTGYPDGSELQVRKNIRVVYGVGADNQRQGLGEGLFFVRRLLDNYDKAGVAPEDRTMIVVLYNQSAYWLLNADAWTRLNPQGAMAGETNVNVALVEELLGRGVHFEICETTMKQKKWEPADLLPGVKIVPGAYARIVDLQHLGFAYVGFD